MGNSFIAGLVLNDDHCDLELEDSLADPLVLKGFCDRFDLGVGTRRRRGVFVKNNGDRVGVGVRGNHEARLVVADGLGGLEDVDRVSSVLARRATEVMNERFIPVPEVVAEVQREYLSRPSRARSASVASFLDLKLLSNGSWAFELATIGDCPVMIINAVSGKVKFVSYEGSAAAEELRKTCIKALRAGDRNIQKTYQRVPGLKAFAQLDCLGEDLLEQREKYGVSDFDIQLMLAFPEMLELVVGYELAEKILSNRHRVISAVGDNFGEKPYLFLSEGVDVPQGLEVVGSPRYQKGVLERDDVVLMGSDFFDNLFVYLALNFPCYFKNNGYGPGVEGFVKMLAGVRANEAFQTKFGPQYIYPDDAALIVAHLR